jgi:hypothetical protein
VLGVDGVPPLVLLLLLLKLSFFQLVLQATAVHIYPEP